MEISIPDNIRFLLLGAGDLARSTLARLPELFDSTTLISNGQWDQVWSSDNSETIFNISRRLEIPGIDANSYADVMDFVRQEKPNICLTLGTKWIFKSDFLQHFDGCVFNYHPSRLPGHRGGGVYSWQILNGVTDACVTIHQTVDKIDAGPIVLQRKRRLRDRPYPTDFSKACKTMAEEIISEFLNLVKNKRGKTIELTEQKEEQSSYFPLLKSAINGAINFDWDIDSLERFIRAFSDPFPGAFTFYRKKLIQIMEAEILDREETHPFGYGMVTALLDNGDAKIACRGGALRIQKIKRDDTLIKPAEIMKTGYRLWTPVEYLDRSRRYRPRAR